MYVRLHFFMRQKLKSSSNLCDKVAEILELVAIIFFAIIVIGNAVVGIQTHVTINCFIWKLIIEALGKSLITFRTGKIIYVHT